MWQSDVLLVWQHAPKRDTVPRWFWMNTCLHSPAAYICWTTYIPFLSVVIVISECRVPLSVCVLQMGGMEAVITGLTDDFKILKRNRKLFTFATAFGTFLIALLCITNVSVYARVLFQSSTLMTITDTSNWWYSQVWMACSVIKWCHCRVEGSNQDRRWKKICLQIWNDQNAPASHTVTDLN